MNNWQNPIILNWEKTKSRKYRKPTTTKNPFALQFQCGGIFKWSNWSLAIGGATYATRRFSIDTVFNGTSKASTCTASPSPAPTATGRSTRRTRFKRTSASTTDRSVQKKCPLKLKTKKNLVELISSLFCLKKVSHLSTRVPIF